ncbi:hypothetical protein B0J14DRAFT_573341 [Halenospora varia]|nr:hypothetical protein B0J14DRAFT_573341 [Halenospora varia]
MYWYPLSTLKSSGLPPESQAAIAIVSGWADRALGVRLFPSSAVLHMITIPWLIALSMAVCSGPGPAFWKTTRLRDIISTSREIAQLIPSITLSAETPDVVVSPTFAIYSSQQGSIAQIRLAICDPCAADACHHGCSIPSLYTKDSPSLMRLAMLLSTL